MSDLQTPSQKLAARIVSRLVESSLLRQEDRLSFEKSLTEGNITQEEWDLRISVADTKEDAE